MHQTGTVFIDQSSEPVTVKVIAASEGILAVLAAGYVLIHSQCLRLCGIRCFTQREVLQVQAPNDTDNQGTDGEPQSEQAQGSF